MNEPLRPIWFVFAPDTSDQRRDPAQITAAIAHATQILAPYLQTQAVQLPLPLVWPLPDTLDRWDRRSTPEALVVVISATSVRLGTAPNTLALMRRDPDGWGALRAYGVFGSPQMDMAAGILAALLVSAAHTVDPRAPFPLTFMAAPRSTAAASQVTTAQVFLPSYPTAELLPDQGQICFGLPQPAYTPDIDMVCDLVWTKLNVLPATPETRPLRTGLVPHLVRLTQRQPAAALVPPLLAHLSLLAPYAPQTAAAIDDWVSRVVRDRAIAIDAPGRAEAVLGTLWAWLVQHATAAQQMRVADLDAIMARVPTLSPRFHVQRDLLTMLATSTAATDTAPLRARIQALAPHDEGTRALLNILDTEQRWASFGAAPPPFWPRPLRPVLSHPTAIAPPPRVTAALALLGHTVVHDPDATRSVLLRLAAVFANPSPWEPHECAALAWRVQVHRGALLQAATSTNTVAALVRLLQAATADAGR